MQRIMKTFFTPLLLALVFLLPAAIFAADASAAPTTSVTIKKLSADGNSVLAQKTLDYRWMMNNLPVMGDGATHYYHQGPVFVDNPDEAREQTLRWNQAEDTNVDSKDMGAVKGTNLKDLCDLVGGMGPGDTLRIKAKDGLSKTFAYQNVYRYSPREGPMVLCWYRDGQYPDSGYSESLRLVWLADTSTNPWGLHVFGNWDWYKAAEPRYWYFYQSGGEKYPTTTGLSVQYVSELTINSSQPASADSATGSAPLAAFTAEVVSGPAPLTVRFTDQSTNSPTAWAWDFDNNGAIDSNEANPTFTYQKEGIYSVKLSVQNTAGSDDEIKADYIKTGPGAPSSIPAEGTTGEPAAGEAKQAEVEPGPSSSSLVPLLVAALVILGAGTAYVITTRKKDK